jgi:glycosyltransferase involved in cell wall biosynthesis
MTAWVTAVVLTHDEAPNIGHCLASVVDWLPVIVVDSGSTDGTLDICARHGARVVHHPYESHAAQWAWALDHLDIDTPWVLALDADFVVDDDLRRQIERDLPTIADDVDGIYVRHRYVFGGGPIRFGGTKQYWLRMIRRGHARPDLSDLVDFRFNVDRRTVRWSGSVTEYNRHDDDISVWLRKQDKFSLRLAVEEELRLRGQLAWEGRPNLMGNPDQRFMRLRDLWGRLPLFLRPVIYFLYRYVLALGFIDGRAGFLYHVLQGFWMRLVVDWKRWQLQALDLATLEAVKTAMFRTRGGSVREVLALAGVSAAALGEEK